MTRRFCAGDWDFGSDTLEAELERTGPGYALQRIDVDEVEVIGTGRQERDCEHVATYTYVSNGIAWELESHVNPTNIRNILNETNPLSIVNTLRQVAIEDPSLADELNPVIARLEETFGDLDAALRDVGA